MSCTPDVLMDPLTEDLPAFTRLSRGLEAIGQRVRIRMGTHVGDWPLDKTAGIDWTAILATKPLDLAGLAALLALEVLDTPGVLNVQDLEWSQDGGTASISATVLTECGVLPVVIQPQDAAGNLSIFVGGVIGHSTGILP